jgi:hypothetical protein
MLRWGILVLALTQSPSEEASPVVTKLVMESECHIPAAPPCIPFNDPRWKVEGCRVDDGACFVLGVEAERPEIRVNLVISPKCGDQLSRDALRDAALATLFDSGYNLFSFEEKDVRCSRKGFVDIKVTVEASP